MIKKIRNGEISMSTIIIFLVIIGFAIAVIAWYLSLQSTGKDIISTFIK